MSSSLSSSSSSSLSSSAPPPPPVEQPTASAEDSLYAADEAKLTALREAKPWTQDPKYMKKVRIGPSAAMKMLQHTYSGVERGIKAGGKPIEVMGLLFGRPNTEEENAFVVTDAFPLPIEGFETRVIADDMDVQNYMISLQETLEELYGLKERFMGWYHSHPFDVNEQWSHCYLSNTDLSTQLAWQRSEDPHGNPWLAIVVDPLRSLAKNHPEFAAFRAYPPEYAPPANETPDGKLVDEESKRVEQWGACWNRYYKLDVEYFMSTQAKAVIGILSKQVSGPRFSYRSVPPPFFFLSPLPSSLLRESANAHAIPLSRLLVAVHLD
jgi:COP9 signalosome complex subunit 5